VARVFDGDQRPGGRIIPLPPTLTIDMEIFWNGPGLSATADGRLILFVPNDQTENDIMLVESFP
jgi:hypothetical protein